MIFALLLGGQLYGFIGAFIALPIAAILRESFDYFRQNLRVRAVGPARRAAAGAGRACADPIRARPARSAASAAPAGASECPACGTELGGPDAEAAAASTAPG